MHGINVWAGSSLACGNVFWHVAVLTSSFSPGPSGGEVLANFFICNVHGEKDSNCVQITDFISFYCFDLNCILQAWSTLRFLHCTSHTLASSAQTQGQHTEKLKHTWQQITSIHTGKFLPPHVAASAIILTTQTSVND